MASSVPAQKLRNYCNILRDDLSACGHAQADGLSYLLAPGQSILAAQVGAQASGEYASTRVSTACTDTQAEDIEQLTFLLFLKMADEQISTAWKMVVIGAK